MLVKILIDFKTLSLTSSLHSEKKPLQDNLYTGVFSLAGKEEASDRVLKSIRILVTIGILKQLQKLFDHI